jgi:hypothetical protein
MNNPFNSSRNPQELVDRYLQAVRFWLPKAQQDLTAELGEDLHSQIEAREAEAGAPIDEAEVSAILKRCGNPMVVAGRLAPKRYLIGPTLFTIYEFVLKMVLLWILVPIFIFIVGPVNLAKAHGDIGPAIAATLANLWTALFIAAGVITLVFAILERTNAHLGHACKWDPLKLPPLRQQERKTSFVQTVCELAFGWFGMVWLLLLPHYPVLILGPAASFLKVTPTIRFFYLPIVVLAVLGLIRSGMTLARPQWTSFPLWSQLLQSALTLLLLSFLIKASGQMQGGEWHPFVIASAAASNSDQAIHMAAIVNVSILISLLGTWVGFCIASVIQLWRLLRHVFNRMRIPVAASVM